ncbi:homocysteine S-methyltransferase family protein [Desulfitobacterium metallireducens]|uniref:Homocysteine S-methyltransferase n=1 Tax=Desulfitobacterium metallireducens DSM 15288 TaxID=871968 RepID=W0ED40_9FIRM|nr:homocysteine S-methyltransferase family protein [Desulfitobacterium metallireducens]AHF07114.1 homocysteine S-methyltransferase [Desulfitobacterium metallireducens DSM 15288]
MDFTRTFKASKLIFTEGAVVERLRREYKVQLDQHIVHSGLVYDQQGKLILRGIYKQYIDIVRKSNIPMMIFTPTRRSNPEQIAQAGLIGTDVNGDCARLLMDIRSEYGEYSKRIFIGGLMGCKGDAYNAEEALSSEEALSFHQEQANALADAGVDFLCGTTLPAMTEAIGLAQAMARTGKPYILSFVIRANGTLLDGNSLHKTISKIDEITSPQPLFYMTNCIHPSILLKAIGNHENFTNAVKQRLKGIQANTSSKSPEELDGVAQLISEDVVTLINEMGELHNHHQIKVLGGCCGTDERHIQGLVKLLTTD